MELIGLALVAAAAGCTSTIVPMMLPLLLGYAFFNYQDSSRQSLLKRVTLGLSVAIGITGASLALPSGGITDALMNVGFFAIGHFGSLGWKKVLDPNRMYIP